MSLELKQNLKLTQQLIMTPQLQQAIKLLQLSRIELADMINQELEQNPLLEEKALNDDSDSEIVPEVDEIKVSTRTEEITGEGDGKDEFDWNTYLEDYGPTGVTYNREESEPPPYENMLTKIPSLSDHLMWQLNLSRFTEEEKRVGVLIIGNLDNAGYLASSLEEIASVENSDVDFVGKVLRRIQEFDPPGIAARNLQECLLLQLEFLALGNPLTERIIRDHLKDLETRNYVYIAKKQKVTVEDVFEAVQVIAGLNPKPGLLYNEEKPQYIIPDVFVSKVGDEYRIVLNDEGLPRVKISAYYKEILNNANKLEGEGDCKKYVRERLQSAVWLLKSIQQRQKTIYRVAESIVRHQLDFFDKGINYLKPMVLRDIAYDVEMHESTISRVTTNKYMYTPRGTFELKYFFNSGINRTNGDTISSESVKEKIRKIIGEEDIRKPYSDIEIVAILEASGIAIARRTVAKYREVMNILPSSKRKKFFL